MSSVCISIFHFAYKLIYMKHDLMSLFLVASTENTRRKIKLKKELWKYCFYPYRSPVSCIIARPFVSKVSSAKVRCPWSTVIRYQLHWTNYIMITPPLFWNWKLADMHNMALVGLLHVFTTSVKSQLTWCSEKNDSKTRSVWRTHSSKCTTNKIFDV